MSTTQQPDSARAAVAAWHATSRAGKIAFLLVAAALFVLALSVWPLVRTAFGPRPQKLSASTDKEQHAQQQDAAFSKYLAQIKGRSLFIVPPAPAPPTPAVANADEPAKPPPPPSSYGGPAIVAMMSDVVWFNNGSRLKPGDKADDLEVVSLSPPWEATLKWKDVEFVVRFFDRSRITKDPEASPKPSPEHLPGPPASENPAAKPVEPPTSDPAPPRTGPNL